MKIIAGVVGVALLVTGCSTTSSSAGAGSGGDASAAAARVPSDSMTGILMLETGVATDATFTNSTHQDGPCKGENGYEDIDDGTQVTVYDASAKVVGLGALEAGKVTGLACMFKFRVDKLPKGNFYKVEVSHRGQVTESADQLQDVVLTLNAS